MWTSSSLVQMDVKVGWFCVASSRNLVEEALEKQDAKKRFKRLALPVEDDSEQVSKERLTGIRLVLGESLWNFFQKSWGELMLEVREFRKRDRAALRAAVTLFLRRLYLDQAASVANCLAALKDRCFKRMSLTRLDVR